MVTKETRHLLEQIAGVMGSTDPVFGIGIIQGGGARRSIRPILPAARLPWSYVQTRYQDRECQPHTCAAYCRPMRSDLICIDLSSMIVRDFNAIPVTTASTNNGVDAAIMNQLDQTTIDAMVLRDAAIRYPMIFNASLKPVRSPAIIPCVRCKPDNKL